jgi:2,3-dihydro-2,3-dihydroxybenzoate dehydrogenase
MAFSGKVVAVTGAASGIGRATALGFGRLGAQVVLCDLQAQRLQEVATTMTHSGATPQTVACDVSNQVQATQALDGIVKQFGRVDILVNAAGINRAGETSHKPLMDTSEADWDRIMEVNLLGTVHCAQAAARHMMQRHQGRIINIASVAGAVPRMHSGAYCVSKAGVRMLTKCLALELARYGITVNAVSPGPTETSMLGVATDGTDDPHLRERMIVGIPDMFRLGVPLGKLGQPEDVASAILYLASDEAHHITGVILNVDGMAQLS